MSIDSESRPTIDSTATPRSACLLGKLLDRYGTLKGPLSDAESLFDHVPPSNDTSKAFMICDSCEGCAEVEHDGVRVLEIDEPRDPTKTRLTACLFPPEEPLITIVPIFDS